MLANSFLILASRLDGNYSHWWFTSVHVEILANSFLILASGLDGKHSHWWLTTVHVEMLANSFLFLTSSLEGKHSHWWFTSVHAKIVANSFLILASRRSHDTRPVEIAPLQTRSFAALSVCLFVCLCHWLSSVFLQSVCHLLEGTSSESRVRQHGILKETI